VYSLGPHQNNIVHQWFIQIVNENFLTKQMIIPNTRPRAKRWMQAEIYQLLAVFMEHPWGLQHGENTCKCFTDWLRWLFKTLLTTMQAPKSQI
jgi:hypothetical protein